MHSLLVSAVLIAALSSYLPTSQGQGKFDLKPFQDGVRGTLQSSGGGKTMFDLNTARASLGHERTVWSNDNNKLNAGGFVSKPLNSNPFTVGGNLGYQHLPSGSGLNLGVQKTPHFGTDVSATGTGNLWRNGNSRLDAVGSYSRHFGGPFGAGRPQYYGGLQFQTRF